MSLEKNSLPSWRRLTLICIFLLGLAGFSFAQITITPVYNEDFEDSAFFDGVDGIPPTGPPGTTFNDPGGNFTIDSNDSQLNGGNDFIEVRSFNGSRVLGWRDVDAPQANTAGYPTITSSNINLAPLPEVSLVHFTFFAIGLGNLENTDRFLARIIVDGVQIFEENLLTNPRGQNFFNNNGAADEFTDGTYSTGFVAVPAGANNIQVQIAARNNANTEIYAVDNLFVEVITPEPSRSLLLLVALAIISSRRRREKNQH